MAGAVAAVVINKKHSQEENVTPGSAMVNERQDTLSQWMKEPSVQAKRAWVLHELKEKCKEERQRESSYRELFAFLFYTVLFAALLWVQRRTWSSYQVVSVTFGILPEQDEFTTWDGVLQWLNESVISDTFVDPECGDAICQAPFEYKAWGAEGYLHGCPEDCGEELELTRVHVHLDYSAPQQGNMLRRLQAQGGDDMVRPEPLVWNVCSRSDASWCVFLDNHPDPNNSSRTWNLISPGDVQDLEVHLPDDEWQLVFSGDARYLRGYVRAAGPADGACKVVCTAGDAPCSLECAQATDELTRLPQYDANGQHLLAFEVCDYVSGSWNTPEYVQASMTPQNAGSVDNSTTNSSSPTSGNKRRLQQESASSHPGPPESPTPRQLLQLSPPGDDEAATCRVSTSTCRTLEDRNECDADVFAQVQESCEQAMQAQLPPSTPSNASLAFFCPDQCCATPEDCMALNTTRLVEGPYLWEGLLEVQVVDAAQGPTWSSVCWKEWRLPSAMVACKELGFPGAMHSLMTTTRDVPASVVSNPDPISPYERRDGVAQLVDFIECEGDEAGVLQCSLATSSAMSTQPASCEEDEVVSLQCWPGNDVFVQDVCAREECCAAGCVPSRWAEVIECQEYNAQATGCYAAVQGNGVCNEACNSAACGFDDWDCCPLGQILDSPSGNYLQCCTPSSAIQTEFDLKTFGGKENFPFSEARTLANNRMVGGVALHQQRTSTAKLDNRFSKLYPQHTTGVSTEAYGLNPYSLRTSSLYDETINMSAIYAEEERVLNSPDKFPAFIAHDFDGEPKGFPVIFSMTLSQVEAQDLVAYMRDGYYFDGQSSKLLFQGVMYNGEVDMFVNLRLYFQRSEGGSISWRYQSSPVDVNLYTTKQDMARGFFEALYLVIVMINAYSEALEAYKTYQRTGYFSKHFESAWNYVDVLSICHNIFGSTLWVYMAVYCATEFDIELAYDIYEHKGQRLKYNPGPVKDMSEAFEKLNYITMLQSLYMSCSAANLFLFLLRIFKLLDFQPQMGVMTRTISKAMSDLLHFFALLTIVFCLYVIMGNVVFGPTVEVFASVERATMTTFNMLLGEFGNTYDDIFSDLIYYGVLMIPAVIFFYTFMFIVFLVILNFLLAIVVDAFTDVKSENQDGSSMFQELMVLAHNLTKSSMSSEYRATQSLAAIENQLQELEGPQKLEIAEATFEGEDVPTKIIRLSDDKHKIALTADTIDCLLDLQRAEKQMRPANSLNWTSALSSKSDVSISYIGTSNLATAACELFGETVAAQDVVPLERVGGHEMEHRLQQMDDEIASVKQDVKDVQVEVQNMHTTLLNVAAHLQNMAGTSASVVNQERSNTGKSELSMKKKMRKQDVVTAESGPEGNGIDQISGPSTLTPTGARNLSPPPAHHLPLPVVEPLEQVSYRSVLNLPDSRVSGTPSSIRNSRSTGARRQKRTSDESQPTGQLEAYVSSHPPLRIVHPHGNSHEFARNQASYHVPSRTPQREGSLQRSYDHERGSQASSQRRRSQDADWVPQLGVRHHEAPSVLSLASRSWDADVRSLSYSSRSSSLGVDDLDHETNRETHNTEPVSTISCLASALNFRM